MCSIIGSKNLGRLQELIEINKVRGVHSCSFSVLADMGFTVLPQRHLEPISEKLIPAFTEGQEYVIAHAQAPTTDAKDISAVHPASVMDCVFVWHNGIIASQQMRRWERNPRDWDTQAIADRIFNTLPSINLDFIHGSFALAFTVGSFLYVARNERCPMYVDKECTISSMPFEGSEELPKDTIFQVDFKNEDFIPVKKFEPYKPLFYFGD